MDNREKEMSAVEDKWERDFNLIGATAIEDRLQDQLRNIFLRQLKPLNS